MDHPTTTPSPSAQYTTPEALQPPAAARPRPSPTTPVRSELHEHRIQSAAAAWARGARPHRSLPPTQTFQPTETHQLVCFACHGRALGSLAMGSRLGFDCAWTACAAKGCACGAARASLCAAAQTRGRAHMAENANIVAVSSESKHRHQQRAAAYPNGKHTAKNVEGRCDGLLARLAGAKVKCASGQRRSNDPWVGR